MVFLLLAWKSTSATLTGWCLVDWSAQDWETQLGTDSPHQRKLRYLHTETKSHRHTRYSSCKRDSNRWLHLRARSRRTRRLPVRKLGPRYSEHSRGLRIPRRYERFCTLVYRYSRHSGRLRTFRKSSLLRKIALRCIVLCMYDWLGNAATSYGIPVRYGI